jgi:hypothetical protein
MHLIHHSTHMSRVRGAFTSRNRRRARAIAASTLLCLTAVSCGGDGPLAPGMGSGSLTTSGAVSTSGTGLAIFQSISSGGTSLFQIVVAPISQTATTWSLQIANYSGRLTVGTYNLLPLSGSPTSPTANFYYTNAGNIQVFSSTSGQLVITSSSSSTVRGTFTFTATDPTSGTSTVTAHGTFDAQCAPGTTCQ